MPRMREKHIPCRGNEGEDKIMTPKKLPDRYKARQTTPDPTDHRWLRGLGSGDPPLSTRHAGQHVAGWYKPRVVYLIVYLKYIGKNSPEILRAA